MAKLQRTTFKTSRAAQYVEARALTAMTGQGEGKFANVVAKELMDNALDACETHGFCVFDRFGSRDKATALCELGPPSLRKRDRSEDCSAFY